jgi:hypothetical protein
MRFLMSFRGFAAPTIVISGGALSTAYVYSFYDTEMLVNRYDTTSGTTSARGWFFR